ncbi:M60 family metallopeptidase [Mycoplasma nasistruthionis]|uniref:Peptidase M60 domain-containing protein n=1 Tax=Mycoplasma nasistruthionis TaxID=353852 RepID=A0A4Y6I5Q8_9MOLU|nr:M60 family metallopeptidase [Mycoplasma nasistruthionis]QDF64853.1 hypothetical protein FIV53_00805 [Mycoplasma nasistruthionis]
MTKKKHQISFWKKALVLTTFAATSVSFLTACNEPKHVLDTESQLKELNNVASQVTVSYSGKETVLASDTNINNVIFVNFDTSKYQVVDKKITNKTPQSIFVAFKLQLKNNDQVVSQKITNEITGFKDPEAEELRALRKQAENALNNATLIEKASEPAKLIDDIDASDFGFDNYDKNLYEITHNLVRKNNSYQVVAEIKVKAKDIKFYPSKTFTPQLNQFTTEEKISKKLTDEILPNISVDFEGNRAETLTTNVVTSQLIFSDLDDSKYEVIGLKIQPLDTSIQVSFKIKDKRYEPVVALSDLKTTTIDGFKRDSASIDALNAQLAKIQVAFNSSSETTISDSVKETQINFTNYDEETYSVENVILNPNNTILSIKFNLKDKSNNLISEPKTVEISGFLDRQNRTKELINTLLNQLNVTKSNNGYFLNNNSAIELSLEHFDAQLSPATFTWYADGQEVYNQTSNTLTITRPQIVKDTNYSLKVSSEINNEIISRTIDNITIFNVNPLANAILNASNNGQLINNQAILNITGIENSAITSVEWYSGESKLSTTNNLTYTATSDGEYHAILINANGVQFKTNSVHVSAMEIRNNNPQFAAKLSKEANLSTSEIKILDRKPRTNIQTKYYDTNLLRTYQQYGFKYPGYDKNYENGGNSHSESFLNYTDASGVRQNINIHNLVLNETVDNESVFYNNTDWIKSEIAQNNLKIHPAVKTFYVNNVKADTETVTKSIVLSTAMTGYNQVGLYIPAGEVAEIELDEDFYNQMLFQYGTERELPIEFILNKNYWDNKEFNNSGMISNRYPRLISTFKYKLSEATNRRFKIGSPFGGSITINLPQKLYDKNGAPMEFKAKIYNAVEMLFYQYGVTTKQEWDDQIQRVISGKITAPVISMQTNYSSILIPFDNGTQKTLKGLKVQDFIFPEENMHKWDNFYQTSFTWSNYNHNKIALNYCDDVFDGAFAWGGGDNLYAYIQWAKRYFQGEDDFGFDNWGNYHEVNHNFEQIQDPFNIRDHGWTNIPSLVNLSYINDQTSFRNELNYEGYWSSGWARLGNLYTISKLKRNNDWYSFYGALIYTLGAENFVNWVKASAVAGKHNQELETMKFLSNYFKLNLYYAGSTFTGLVRDKADFRLAFPDKSQLNDLEYDGGFIKKELKKIEDAYPAIDFVGNLYAVGNYLYNSETREFEYGDDVQAEIQIPAFEDYVFDFEKNIASMNPNFAWDRLEVSATTKWGGTLSVNGKKSDLQC